MNHTKSQPRTKNIKEYIKNIPYFRFENLLVFEKNREYLRIMLSRMSKSGEIVRLKKGLYVHKDFITETKIKNEMDEYLEFIACSIFEGAYLSMEYVLSENNVLSENVYGYSLVSSKKTNKVNNKFGTFINHSIKKELMTGYDLKRVKSYLIKKASAAKALFDFLYFRKNIITNMAAFDELRLNLDNFSKDDLEEFSEYVNIDGTDKMKSIYNYIKKYA